MATSRIHCGTFHTWQSYWSTDQVSGILTSHTPTHMHCLTLLPSVTTSFTSMLLQKMQFLSSLGFLGTAQGRFALPGILGTVKGRIALPAGVFGDCWRSYSRHMEALLQQGSTGGQSCGFIPHHKRYDGALHWDLQQLSQLVHSVP